MEMKSPSMSHWMVAAQPWLDKDSDFIRGDNSMSVEVFANCGDRTIATAPPPCGELPIIRGKLRKRSGSPWG